MKLTAAKIFGDNMVLQRGKGITVWGTAEDGCTITVELNEARAAATARNGIWKAVLAPLDACLSCEMSIRDDRGNSLVFRNVAVGEVWIAGGQSNMEMRMYADPNYHALRLTADNPNIRYYDCPKISYEGQLDDEDYSEYGFWRSVTGRDLTYFSMVGYYFAGRLHGELGVAIGIVGCNLGGSPAAPWVEESYLTDELECYLHDGEEALKDLDMDEYKRVFKEERERMNSPEAKKMMADMYKKEQRTPLEPQSINFDDKKMQMIFYGPRSPFRAGGLYHCMLEKIMPYAASGFIWYQGESDVRRADIYDRLFGQMIRCWRDGWGEELPFLFVQLAPLESYSMHDGNNFIPIRAAQDKVSKTVANTYMACIMDVGMQYDIHPKLKQPVGERLALLALGKAYGRDILCESPEAVSAAKDNGSVTIGFEHAGEGLHVEGEGVNALEVYINNAATEDYHVEISGWQMKISTPLITAQAGVEVRFAWTGFCVDNLYNSAGLPAKPFVIKI